MPLARSAAVFLFALTACDGPPVEFGPCRPEKVAHVQGFGYYAGAPFADELAAYSNIVWGPASAVPAARAAGHRAVVDVQGVFQAASANPPTAEVIAGRWASLADALRPDLDAVAALYVSDEPYWSASRANVPFAEVQQRLEAAAQLIRATPGFERVPLAIIFADIDVEWIVGGRAGKPAGYDWLGWDLYDFHPRRLDERLGRFLSLVGPEQRMIAVPDAFVWQLNDEELSELEVRIAFWLAWIERHPQVVMVAPFIYQSGNDHTGARDLPWVRDRYAQIGGCIVEANAARLRAASPAAQSPERPTP
jgi:hypothetical protein